MAADHLVNPYTNRPYKWEKSTLKVYVDTTNLPENRKDDFKKSVKDAATEWSNIDKSDLKFEFTDTKSEADVVVNFDNVDANGHPLDINHPAIAVPSYTPKPDQGYDKVTKMEVTIFKDLESELAKARPDITLDQLLNIIYNHAKHEYGHTATQADSKTVGDMMGWPGKTYDDYLEKRSLTENDKSGVQRDFAPLSACISPLSASILVGQSVTFTSTVSGGYTPYSYQWYLDGAPVSGATSASWTFTPTTSGIYYVHLKVTDAKANTARSDVARISVAAVPVGGYSFPIQVQTKAEPVLPYIALIAILTAVFTKMRPKTKRRR
jgi:hypothetical protein